MTEIAERPLDLSSSDSDMGHVSHWINGRSSAGTSGRRGPVFNPATGRQEKWVDFASVEEVDAAVAAAAAAFPAWRATSLSKRTEILFRIRNLVDQHRKEIAAFLTAEHGKVPSDALGEVARGLENLEFATGIPHLMKGGYSEQVSAAASTSTSSASRSASSRASRRSTSRRWCPCGCSATPSRAATASSSSRPRRTRRPRSTSPSCWPRRACRRACSASSRATRWPSIGSSSTRDIKAVSFVGSTPIAKYIYETGTRNGKRVQALGGAKNHMIVLPDADIDMAADAAVSAAYGSSGRAMHGRFGRRRGGRRG